MAQAGSRPPVYFDSQNTFFYSGTSIAASQSGQALDEEPVPAVFPDGVWQLPQSSQYLLWVELAAGRLSVLENTSDKGFILRKRIPISIGKLGIGKHFEGDKKTPVGIYRFTSFLRDDALNDYYGIGAYPLNYPNALDRLAGRTGHGIWLHGLPKQVQERPFLDSDGCVIIDNESLRQLAAEISPGTTQVVLSREAIKWVTAAEHEVEANSLRQALGSWERAWESRVNADYLGFYSEDFSDLSRNKQQWEAYKSRVNDSKRYIAVELDEVSMLQSPELTELVDVKFYQSYVSDDYSWKGWKHQLWRHESSGWKIIYEGSI